MREMENVKSKSMTQSSLFTPVLKHDLDIQIAVTKVCRVWRMRAPICDALRRCAMAICEAQHQSAAYSRGWPPD